MIGEGSERERGGHKRRLGLGVKLAFGFAAVAAMTALLAAVLITATWQTQFESYVRRGLESRAEDAASVMHGVYVQYGGWEHIRFMDLSHVGLTMSGLRLQVFDESGAMVGDSRGGSLPQAASLELPGGSREPAASAPIVVGGRKVGEVRVIALSPGGLLTDRDVEFREGSLDSLMLAAIIAVAAASVAGMLMARNVARPVAAVTAVADRLRSGQSDARTRMSGGDQFAVLGRTIDEMADAIEAERRSERRLTADVAHELRTPLQAIQATVEAMQDGVLPADPQRLGVVRDETVRLARLANSILELAKLESGSTRLERRILDPAEPVAAAVEAHRAMMESCSLSFEARLQRGSRVEADGDRLTQAVGNLLANAARYTPEGGRVTVVLKTDKDEAHISVSDDGIGISETDREHVFKRFWRADPARDRSKGGVGIGLAVVCEIVERHEGRVELAPLVPGERGSTFVIRLPLVGS